ncbi:MAG: preprotein translocase subunit SecA [Oxalobacter sp.]|nr:preprotein translocase subunit SecA [Oxalobacter sp.]
MSFFTSIFGSRNSRLLKSYGKTVAQINALEPAMEALSDEALQAKTPEFKQRLANGESLDNLLPEAFAVCREASRRVLKMRHFDVQLLGGMALHYGKIAEMATGEGKTLVATLPAYLNGLTGQGVHVVTVNDYLAQRDAEWMSRLYGWLGLSTGVNLPSMSHEEKQQAYAADITYGTNNEYGFDYLRDNMVYRVSDRVQRGLAYGIVDEVDSILIDEARTPLIISGQAEDSNDLYERINEIPPKLTLQIGEETKDGKGKIEVPGDYTKDEKTRQVYLTDAGYEKAEKILAEMGLLQKGASLYDAAHIILVHHLYAALRAHALYHRDQHYVVQNDEIVIVDEFTGRLMEGRRWSEGLHQAIEAKEHVTIQNENQTLASITFQNYFRMYNKLSGMTGTADTEAYEFQDIYGLETVVIPTNRPNQRKDAPDLVYRSEEEKYEAVLGDIKDCYDRGQPVLVGTTSIENSERLSAYLTKMHIPHNVLNAKQHAREAQIVAQAGRPKMITIATNMAGRGTDIVLGGNVEKQVEFIQADDKIPEEEKAAKIKQLQDEWQSLHDFVLAQGGLHIIGTERHESRRVDNQLRGRSARQGDPGSSRFYLSLDDELLRIFAGDTMRAVMNRLNMPRGEAIESKLVSRSIESAQRKVEGHNFDMRKQLLKYDDVANEQRKVLYQQRNELLEMADTTELARDLRHGTFTDLFRAYFPEESIEEQWDIAGLEKELKSVWQVEMPVPMAQMLEENKTMTDDDLLEELLRITDERYEAKIEMVDREAWIEYERGVILQSMDNFWREHLSSLDHLRKGIHLRGYAHKNPEQEYKFESFKLFDQMLRMIRDDATKVLFLVQIRTREEVEAEQRAIAERAEAERRALEEAMAAAAQQDQKITIKTTISDADSESGNKGGGIPRVGRNEPCPCGSGKKYKHCHGKLK